MTLSYVHNVKVNTYWKRVTCKTRVIKILKKGLRNFLLKIRTYILPFD